MKQVERRGAGGLGKAAPASRGDPAAGMAAEVDRRLLRCYGDREWSPRFGELLDGLVHTILSQNTSDVNSHRAFEQLKEAFPTWEDAAGAATADIEEAIRSGGISRVKAERIKAVLEMVRADCGSYSLECLREMGVEQARDYLLGMPGVGRKTAAVLLLFQLGYPLFPVDTHILRVGKRLGLIPPRASADQAHDIMDTAVPDDIKFRLHINLIEHGRAVCKARKPDCPGCCLNDICPRVGLKEEGSGDA
ncbi:MAG: endonuclease III [Actinomycetota bacterium]|nr:endonuclease III [Actinomycetota bacterium]MDD5667741.1 endonuclease III [Actinomycetota bacterium]